MGSNISGWTDERRAEAKRRWREGESAGQIAKVLGGVSRNAVIGILNRAGLTKIDQRTRTTMRLEKTVRAKPAHKQQPLQFGAPRPPVPIPPRKPKPELPYTGEPVPLLSVGAHMCRWPIGEPFRGFCGADKERGSYCARHAKAAYVVAKPGRAA